MVGLYCKVAIGYYPRLAAARHRAPLERLYRYFSVPNPKAPVTVIGEETAQFPLWKVRPRRRSSPRRTLGLTISPKLGPTLCILATRSCTARY